MQLVKKCFTMTNVMLEGGKEVDLLAYNPRSGEKYHIEVRVTIGRGFRLRLIDTQTADGRKHRRGMDTLNEIKFVHPVVTHKVTEIFGSSDYRKVLVVWEVQGSQVIEQAKAVYGIEVWKISDVLNEMMKKIGTKSYRRCFKNCSVNYENEGIIQIRLRSLFFISFLIFHYAVTFSSASPIFG